jgi:pentatricopeptide repeat protein
MKKILVIFGVVIAISFVTIVGWFVFIAVSLTGMTVINKAEYNKVARAGVPIAEAVYMYRNATELYPESIEDLSRIATIAVDTNQWSYEWDNHLARLEYIGSEVPHGLTYSFRDRHSGWSICNRLHHDMRIDAPVRVPPRPARTQDDRYRLIVDEIQKRIARSPTNAVHYQGLISYCVRSDRLEDALSFAKRMHEKELLPWWEMQMLARILNRLSHDNWAEKEMCTAAATNPGFLPFFYMAWFYREVGDTEAAVNALSKASQYPFIGMGWNHYVDDYYFWLATTYAYLEKRNDLVLALCDRWESNDQKRGYGSPNPLALRAAALLAKGNTSEAIVHINRAIEMKEDRAIWADNLDTLSQAIRQGDTLYRWSPGAYPELDDYKLLIEYQ